MEKRFTEKQEVNLSEELKRIFEGDKEESDLICWGYRDYWSPR